jgi:hypothetical protein
MRPTTTIELINHPEWVFAPGLLMHPIWNERQKVRFTQDPKSDWVPDASDPITYAYLLHLYLRAGGSFKDLEGCVVSALLNVWA